MAQQEQDAAEPAAFLFLDVQGFIELVAADLPFLAEEFADFQLAGARLVLDRAPKCRFLVPPCRECGRCSPVEGII